MYEILFRSLPFRENTNIQGFEYFLYKYVVTYRVVWLSDWWIKSCLSRDSGPDEMQSRPSGELFSCCLYRIQALLRDCWSENPEIRPSIRRVRLNTEMVLKTWEIWEIEERNGFRKGSLVDQMLRLMEQYANNLEKLVAERTGLLEDANVRADKLLSQLLPPWVCFELGGLF